MKKTHALLDYQHNWRCEWQHVSFRYKFSIAFLILIFFLLLCPGFLIYAEARQGIFINDFLLSALPSHDLSGIIFFIIYSSLILGISHIVKYPQRFIIALYTYTLVLILRMISIYFVPLEAPANIAVLRDPFVEFFTGSGKAITKDLFFSGHTATIFIMYLFSKNRWLKMFFLASTVAVGVLLLVQHAHYTMDVAAAPVIAFAGYKTVIKLYRKFHRFKFESLLQKFI